MCVFSPSLPAVGGLDGAWWTCSFFGMKTSHISWDSVPECCEQDHWIDVAEGFSL